MLLKGATVSLAVTAALVHFFPRPVGVTPSLQNSIKNPDFWMRALSYLFLQSIAMTIGGMINNPTLS